LDFGEQGHKESIRFFEATSPLLVYNADWSVNKSPPLPAIFHLGIMFLSWLIERRSHIYQVDVHLEAVVPITDGADFLVLEDFILGIVSASR